MNIPLKILHLEDNAQEAEMIRRVLKKDQIKFTYNLVETRENFQNALTVFSPDVILSDHTLPSFGSKEALQIAKNHTLRIPFILVTGTISEEYAVEIMKNGAADYILKNNLHRLPSAVINAVEKNKIEAENAKYLEKLIQNEAMHNEIEKMARLGSWEYDIASGNVKWSDQMYRLFGLEPGEIMPSKANMLKFTHHEDRDFVKNLTDFNLAIRQEKINFVHRVITKNKELKYIKKELVVIKDTDGQPTKLTGFNLDVTETYSAQEALRKSEANLMTIFNNTDTSYLLLDQDLNIISFNEPAIDIFNEYLGKPIETGKNIGSYSPEGKRDELIAKYNDVLKGIPIEYETSYLNKDESVAWYHVRLSPVHGTISSPTIGVVVSLEDISRRKITELDKERLSEELKESHRGLKKLLDRIQTTKEEERLRIATDINYELGSLLLSAQNDLTLIKRRLYVQIKNANTQLEFANTLKTIKKSIKSVKKIASNLRPEMLDKLGLNASIDWQIEQLRQNKKIEVCATISNDFRELELDINKSTTIYRIVEEAFCNILKHAEATKVKAVIKLSNKNVFMVINDNGIGITEDQKNNKITSGLNSLRERVLLLNGVIDFTSQQDGGTIVYAQIPGMI